MTPNPIAWPFRVQYLLGFLVCIALLGYALYEQGVLGVEPCPLCIFQRIAFMFMALFFLLGAIHGPAATGRKAYALLVLLGGAAGIGVASYHIWVQHQPPDPMAGCAPGFTYMVDNFPISKVIKMIFSGHADCAVINWTWLGFSMPEWTLLAFLLLTFGALVAGFRARR